MYLPDVQRKICFPTRRKKSIPCCKKFLLPYYGKNSLPSIEKFWLPNTGKFTLPCTPKPLEIVCFHSQQAAEKIVKCFLVSKGIEPPKTHDMQVLIEMCLEYDDDFNNIYEEATTLTNYAARLRYPTELGLLETDASKAIENADKVMKLVKGMLSQEHDTDDNST